MKRTTTHLGTFEIEVDENDRPVASRNLPDDPEGAAASAGLHEVVEHELRIKRPHVREGWLRHGPGGERPRRGAERFVEVSWEHAYGLVATELERVRHQHGDASVFGGSYGWSSAGRFHHAQSQIHRFLAVDGGYTSSRHSYSVGAQEVVLPHVIGGSGMAMFDWNPAWATIAENTELVLAFGGAPLKNTLVNQGGLRRHHAQEAQQACADAGTRFVCISPVKDDLDASLRAEWIPIRPGTDTALMLAMAHWLITTGREDVDFLSRCCVGYERFRDYVLGRHDGLAKSPPWAEQVCGVPSEVIEELAEDAATVRSLVSVTWSLQRAQHGESTYWAAVTLAAMLGSMGRPGGGFAAGLSATHGIGIHRGSMGAASFPRVRNPVESFIPVSRISDMLLSPGQPLEFNGQVVTYPDVRLVYWAGGNPFHHHQDLNKLLRAWNVPETVVVHDSWWTPVARHADIVIPVATTLERDDIVAGSRDTALLPLRRVVEPVAGVPTDFEAFGQIAALRGRGDQFDEGLTEQQWIERLYEETSRRVRERGVDLPSFAEFWESEGVSVPLATPSRWDVFGDLRADPVAHPLQTPSGRVEIYSATVASFGYEECPGHASWQEPDEWLGGADRDGATLHLLSHQPKGKIHSQLDFSEASLRHKVDGREAVRLHPDTAAALGIADRDVVRLSNRRGSCLAVAVLVQDLHPRVALMATGGWWDPEQPGVHGSTCLQGNPNVLTSDVATSRLAQATAAQTCLVTIRREAAPIPSRAHRPPETVGADDVDG
ncbi:molybdopterin-dependent oxidoreductase [Aeromicrobium sp. CTD01-1L150]|uniref:molybdopterin-dependent oxidoreductase n=1 Tax=Aeromicrobium sp. CTD01-1L150 TaxID=3341830 RepID=UPI0035C1BD0C